MTVKLDPGTSYLVTSSTTVRLDEIYTLRYNNRLISIPKMVV